MDFGDGIPIAEIQHVIATAGSARGCGPLARRRGRKKTREIDDHGVTVTDLNCIIISPATPVLELAQLVSCHRNSHHRNSDGKRALCPELSEISERLRMSSEKSMVPGAESNKTIMSLILLRFHIQNFSVTLTRTPIPIRCTGSVPCRRINFLSEDAGYGKIDAVSSV